MRSTDQIHVVLLQEARDNVRPECEGDATVIFAPTRNVLVRIRPEQVTQETTIGDLVLSVSSAINVGSRRSALAKDHALDLAYICRTHDTPNLLHRVEVWTQTAMHSEDLLVNDRGDWQAIETVCERLP